MADGYRAAAISGVLLTLVSAAGCAAGSGLRLVGAEVESVTLGIAPAGRGEGYVVQRKSGEGDWASVAEVASGVDSFVDVNLKPGTGYSYRLIGTTEGDETDVIRGGEDARPFSVDLAGAHRVALIATEGGDGDGNDHAVWGTPVLVTAKGERVPLIDLKPALVRVGYGNPGKFRTISIGGKEYESSIMAHARSEMVYELRGEYSRFEAMVGIDDTQAEKGSVTFMARVARGEVSRTVTATTPALEESPGNTTYHVDAGSGNDDASGTSPEEAWKSLARVNGIRFAPGDRVLFKSGSRYRGQLKPHGSGKAGSPIIIDKYGGDSKPRIDGEGRFEAAVLVSNIEYWHIRNLEITNTGEERAPKRSGVHVSIFEFGVAHDIRLEGLFVHDVNGSNVKSKGGGAGIHWSNGGSKTPSYFDGLTIENCHLVRCDRNGITAGGYWSRHDWHPSLNVVIRGNRLEDIGGDGIVPIGCDGALIEHNVLKGGRMRADDYAAGIWPWACDNTLIQYNEVSGMKGTKDGQGFDSDYNCRNSIFQYNYSHDNDGGFILICNAGSETDYSIGNIGTIVRYNISQNDGARLFQFGGPTKNTTVHNNVFYTRKGLDVLGIFHNDWNGWSDDVKFHNNIFHADGNVTHKYGKSTNNVYSHNLFFGHHTNLPEDAKAITEDPMFVNPGSGGDGLDSLAGYRLKADSPAIGAGRPMARNCEKDFWGNPTPGTGKPIDIGAHAVTAGK